MKSMIIMVKLIRCRQLYSTVVHHAMCTLGLIPAMNNCIDRKYKAILRIVHISSWFDNDCCQLSLCNLLYL